MEFVLNMFGKSMDNVVALVGDNCSVNTSLSKQANTHFVGCASNRLNLAV